MENIKLELKYYTFCIIFFILLLKVLRPVTTADEISNHIKNCCYGGSDLAKRQNNCEHYEYNILTISPIWRGLCYSTYAVCCSYELEKIDCVAGRLAALTDSRCTELHNTSSYSACCRACQVGLAVKTSGNLCDDTFFKYFFNIESYRICCNFPTDGNRSSLKVIDNFKENYIKDLNKTAILVDKSNHQNKDGVIILQDDDDICGKLPLCEQICENTKESYACKCYAGFMLSDNMVTCIPIAEGYSRNKFERNEDLFIASNNTFNTTNSTEDNVAYSAVEYDDDALGETVKVKECPKGYKIDVGKTSQCIDINECVRELHDCKNPQTCVNINGGFRCANKISKACKFGFVFNNETKKCEDFTTIIIHGHEIPPSSVAAIKNESTLYNSEKNKCEEGFQWKSGNCVDINECEIDDTACDSNQICSNDKGGYHCDCKAGFNLDTTKSACIDINECSINNHNCLPTQRCDNTIGSYVCTRLQSCGTGYTLNADSSTCDDNDECALNTHNCKEGWECYNTKGSFRCYPKTKSSARMTPRTPITLTKERPSTKSSYTSYSHFDNKSLPYGSHESSSRETYESISPLSYQNHHIYSCDAGLQRNHVGICVDINECVLHNNICGSHQRCINTNGSYRCQNRLDCRAGYKSNAQGTECLDIDECKSGEHNCVENQLCRNRNGGFVCMCSPGHHLSYIGKGLSRCVDINECDYKGSKLCPTNSQCINTIGSYFCECKSGFQKSTENERVCLDVDECNEIPRLCHQKCINYFGGYRCTCNNGYELAPDNRTCIDVDECEALHTNKLCMGFCDNVPGSYVCSCPRGYLLANDRITCLDIDECATGKYCTGGNDVCTNKRGGYKCTAIHCPFGYTNDPEQRTRCLLSNNMCEAEDCYNKPSAYTYNFITIVSKSMVPPEGRVFFSLKGPAWYDDIEFDMKVIKIQAAANVEKATNYHFRTTKGDHEIHLSLKRSLEGPQEIEIEITMTVFTKGLLRGKSVAKVFIIVSQYAF